jgi:hypothetical protein
MMDWEWDGPAYHLDVVCCGKLSVTILEELKLVDGEEGSFFFFSSWVGGSEVQGRNSRFRLCVAWAPHPIGFVWWLQFDGRKRASPDLDRPTTNSGR